MVVVGISSAAAPPRLDNSSIIFIIWPCNDIINWSVLLGRNRCCSARSDMEEVVVDELELLLL